jgi:hypothetical protein
MKFHRQEKISNYGFGGKIGKLGEDGEKNCDVPDKKYYSNK